jgi:O-antigen ligase
MQALKSPLFYLPIITILAVNSATMDLGLWQRMTVIAIAGLGTIVMSFKSFEGTITGIGALCLGLLLWPLTKFYSVPAQSELLAHVARISLLFGLILISRQIFKSREKEGILALSLGSQLALGIAALSLFPALLDAYKQNNIYLATGPLFTHKNYAAASLLMLLPFSMMAKSNGPLMVWLQRIVIALGLLCILLLRTRGVWFAGITMGVVALIYFNMRGQKIASKKSFIAIGIFLAGVTTAILAGGSEKIFNSSTIQTRMHYWNAASEMYLDNPLTGVGAGQWKVFYPETGLKGTNESVMNGTTTILRPHNDVLWLLSETGIGVGFFIALVVAGFIISIRKEGNIYMGLTLVAFTVYGFAEFPLERSSMLLPLGIALGYAASRQKPLLKLPKILVAGLAGLAFLFTITVGSARIAGEKNAKQALDGYMSRNTRQMQVFSEKAEGTFFEMDIYNNPMAYFQGLALLTSGGPKPSNKRLLSGTKAFERALEIHPNHMLSLNQLAQIKRIQGDIAGASILYSKVLEMSPRNTSAALKLMEVERTRGNIYAALDALKKLDQKYTPQNLPGLGPEASKTLAAFAEESNPRPASRKLHSELQKVPVGRMWQVWTTNR